jgi:hypothetical protein
VTLTPTPRRESVAVRAHAGAPEIGAVPQHHLRHGLSDGVRHTSICLLNQMHCMRIDSLSGTIAISQRPCLTIGRVVPTVNLKFTGLAQNLGQL